MYEMQYKKKLTTPDDAIKLINKKCNISFAMAVGQPPALIKALGEAVRAGKFEQLHIYYMHAEAPANEHLLQYDLMDVIKPCPSFLGKQERALMIEADKDNRKVIYYVPNSFSHLPRFFRENVELDTMLVTVSPMDKAGYFSFGTNNDYTSSAARSAKKLIVEVNENMPRVFGGSLLHVSEVTAIVENNAPLIELVPRAPSEIDINISKKVAELIPDGATIQMGVGGIPDATCQFLKNKNDLGIHSELLSPGMTKLIQNGNITGRNKNINIGKHVFTLAFGDKAMYEFMNDNPAMESYSVEYVNNPNIISQNDKVISVNAIIEIDLYGQVNAENIGSRQYGGPGGQNDFVRGAYLSKGGKSILAFPATTGHGKLSKIVPKLSSVVTDLRSDTQYVVTEHGTVNLKGMNSTERAIRLIELAAPEFREELKAKAKELHLI